MINDRGHLSSETIDLLLLAALPPPETNTAKAHLDDCADCRTRWQELNEDKQRFDQYVFARTLPKIEARLEKKTLFAGVRGFMIPMLGAIAAGLIAVVALQPGGGDGTQTEDELYVGIKGAEPSLEVYALRGDARFEVKPGAVMHAGDKIRFVVNPGTSKYVLIASRDGAGAFTVYHPFGGQQSQAVANAVPRRTELPGAVELDGTRGAERLVAVFSEKPISAEVVKTAVEANPLTPSIAGARVLSWEFSKDAP